MQKISSTCIFAAVIAIVGGSKPSWAGDFTYDVAQQIVTMEYQAFLFRDPEPGVGPFSHADRIVTDGWEGLLYDSTRFADSPEFTEFVAPGKTPEEILSNIYDVFFHRAVDSSGQATWTPLLASGQYAEVFAGIIGSDEFFDLYVAPNLSK